MGQATISHSVDEDTTPAGPAASAARVTGDADAENRWQEAASLAGQRDKAAVQKLVAYLGDEHPFVRWEAGIALAQTAAQVREKTPTILVDDAAATWPALLSWMQASLQDPNAQRRAATADALAHWDRATAEGILLNALQDPEPLVRSSAAAALGKIRSTAAVDALAGIASSDPSLWVRRAALDALGVIADPRALPALEGSLDEPVPLLRLSAVRAMGHMATAQARRALERCLRDDDAAVRWYAASGLERMGSRESIAALRPLDRDQTMILDKTVSQVAQTAIEAIRRREPNSWDPLYRAWHFVARLLVPRA